MTFCLFFAVLLSTLCRASLAYRNTVVGRSVGPQRVSLRRRRRLAIDVAQEKKVEKKFARQSVLDSSRVKIFRAMFQYSYCWGKAVFCISPKLYRPLLPPPPSQKPKVGAALARPLLLKNSSGNLFPPFQTFLPRTLLPERAGKSSPPTACGCILLPRACYE